MKERDFEPEFEALLRSLIGRVPSLKLVSLKKRRAFAKMIKLLQAAMKENGELRAQLTTGYSSYTGL